MRSRCNYCAIDSAGKNLQKASYSGTRPGNFRDPASIQALRTEPSPGRRRAPRRRRISADASGVPNGAKLETVRQAATKAALPRFDILR